jgi:uncharacterized protein
MTTWTPDQKRMEVPVFPLPRLVLFPGTLLPLHIFEPRYRAMVADCLRAESPLLAVAQLRPGWESKYEGRPAIYDVGGIGRIKEHALNADGTYDIVVDALARVHLQELPADKTYRRASATVLTERAAGLDAGDIQAVFALASQIATLVKRALPAFALQAAATDAPTLIIDRIADQLVLDPAARQDLLETLDVPARLKSLTQLLGELYASLDSKPSTSRTLH